LLYPVVKITFVKKDAPLAQKIIEVIGGGKIVQYKSLGYLDLLFQDLKSIPAYLRPPRVWLAGIG
jgi:hypothetical protein